MKETTLRLNREKNIILLLKKEMDKMWERVCKRIQERQLNNNNLYQIVQYLR